MRSLIRVVDCNVQGLVHDGYGSLFQASGVYSTLLTSILTLYVAAVGYQLLLGRAQLRVTDFALTAVKLGAVLALATRWDLYQSVVYDVLFHGPQQLAGVMLHGVESGGGLNSTDVFEGLQRALDTLSSFATGFAKQPTATASSLLGGVGLGASAAMASSGLLLFSSLGVVLVAKIVLGMLLAVGPLFIGLALFDSTRGLFEGWLRASLAFAFAPLTATLLLGVALTMMAPSLAEMEQMRTQGVYALGPVYSVLTLACVFAGVSVGMLIAGGLIAKGLRLPRLRPGEASIEGRIRPDPALAAAATQPRAAQIAAAAAAMERRDAMVYPSEVAGGAAQGVDRRTVISTTTAGGPLDPGSTELRLGQGSRRSAGPRTQRAVGRNSA